MTQAAPRRRSKPGNPKARKKPSRAAPADARTWLRENGYEDVARMIDVVMAEWESSGKGTRRSWWVTLAGGVDGEPFTVNGRTFPVLASAQIRQGKPVTRNAIKRNPREVPPPVRRSARWPRS